MEQKPKQTTKNFIKEIRRKTSRLFSSAQKLVIVMEAQRGEYSIAVAGQMLRTTLATDC